MATQVITYRRTGNNQPFHRFRDERLFQHLLENPGEWGVGVRRWAWSIGRGPGDILIVSLTNNRSYIYRIWRDDTNQLDVTRL